VREIILVAMKCLVVVTNCLGSLLGAAGKKACSPITVGVRRPIYHKEDSQEGGEVTRKQHQNNQNVLIPLKINHSDQRLPSDAGPVLEVQDLELQPLLVVV